MGLSHLTGLKYNFLLWGQGDWMRKTRRMGQNEDKILKETSRVLYFMGKRGRGRGEWQKNKESRLDGAVCETDLEILFDCKLSVNQELTQHMKDWTAFGSVGRVTSVWRWRWGPSGLVTGQGHIWNV